MSLSCHVPFVNRRCVIALSMIDNNERDVVCKARLLRCLYVCGNVFRCASISHDFPKKFCVRSGPPHFFYGDNNLKLLEACPYRTARTIFMGINFWSFLRGTQKTAAAPTGELKRCDGSLHDMTTRKTNPRSLRIATYYDPMIRVNCVFPEP